MAKVGVIGAGSWGIALAKLLRTNGNEVTVWSIVEEEVAMLRREHEHIDKLSSSYSFVWIKIDSIDDPHLFRFEYISLNWIIY